MIANAPNPLDIIRKVSTLIEDSLARQHLAAALRRLTVLRDDNLMRGRGL
jgi:hypothetical protein